jgi:hypothetical protein
MATREGKRSEVQNKVCAYVPKMKIVRTGGQAKSIAGRLTKRGDS